MQKEAKHPEWNGLACCNENKWLRIRFFISDSMFLSQKCDVKLWPQSTVTQHLALSCSEKWAQSVFSYSSSVARSPCCYPQTKIHPLNLKIKENQLPAPFLKALLHFRAIPTNISSFSPLWALQRRRIIFFPENLFCNIIRALPKWNWRSPGGRDHELLLFSCILLLQSAFGYLLQTR